MKTLNKKFLAQDIEVKSAGQYKKKSSQFRIRLYTLSLLFLK